MGHIIKSLASVCHSVILSVNTSTAAILIRFWWNFAQWFGARKVRSSLFGIKIWQLIPLFYPNFFFKNCIIWLQPTEISKRYNSVPVKDNCALFAPTPPIFGPSLSDGVTWISPLKTPVVMATNRFYSKKKMAAGSQECQTLKRSY